MLRWRGGAATTADVVSSVTDANLPSCRSLLRVHECLGRPREYTLSEQGLATNLALLHPLARCTQPAKCSCSLAGTPRDRACVQDGDAPAATLEQPGDLSSANDGVGGKRTYILEGCVLPLGDIYLLFLGQFLAYFLLAVYLHEVLPDANGVRKTPFYFLLPSYWNPKAKIDASSISRRHEENPRPAAEDTDVIAEADRMRERLQECVLSTLTACTPGVCQALTVNLLGC